MRRVEAFLAQRQIENSDEKNVKFYVAALLARELTGLARPVFEKLPNATKIDEKLIGACYQRIQKIYSDLSKKIDKDSVARGPSLLKKMETQWKRSQAKPKTGDATKAKG
jgi:hypothetical protein